MTRMPHSALGAVDGGLAGRHRGVGENGRRRVHDGLHAGGWEDIGWMYVTGWTIEGCERGGWSVCGDLDAGAGCDGRRVGRRWAGWTGGRLATDAGGGGQRDGWTERLAARWPAGGGGGTDDAALERRAGCGRRPARRRGVTWGADDGGAAELCS